MVSKADLKFRVGVERGVEENIITVQPALSLEQIGELVGAGLLTRVVDEDYRPTGDSSEKTCIPFGRLILGTPSMDRATDNYVRELHTYLNKVA